MSPEALIGIGITIAELGILCLLLGWAEYMRSVRTLAMIWAGLGIVLVIVGGLTAAMPRSSNRRRLDADRISATGAPRGDARSVSEPEEELY